MGTCSSFRGLIIWSKSHELVLDEYKVIKKFTYEKRFGLISQMRRAAVFCIMLTVSSLLLLGACKKEGKQLRQPPAVPVSVATAIQKDIPVQIQAIGIVEAYSTVSLKSRIEGQISKVYFKEGQDVRKGQLLFLIDPRPFEEAVIQAQANLMRDSVQLGNAERDVQRYEELFKEELISKQQYDKILTNYEALKAIVKAGNAALDNAKLHVEYCYIRSPLDGRIGSILTHEGNNVKANENIMVVINQITPVYASFSVPEQELLRIKKAMTSNKLKTEASIQGTERYSATGELTFINNAVDPSTGTILLKATFPNKDKILWPGQFVNVTLILDIRKDAVIISHQSIQTGQDGLYVFVVKPDQTAELRKVVSGIRHGNDVVIEGGIKTGEIIVTDGQLRLTPGAKVEVKNKAEGSSPKGEGERR